MFSNTGDHGRFGRERHRGREFEGGPGGAGPARGHGPGTGEWRVGHRLGRRFPFGWSGMPGGGPAVRRGDVRSAILTVLADGPMHGYQIMQELGERSGGAWRPSAGSVYPTLQQLEDEGLVRGEEQEGRRVFTLTEQGRDAATKAKPAGAPWETGDQTGRDIGRLAMQVARAAMQVHQVGTPAAFAEASRILIQARRDLYRLLAEDEVGEHQSGGEEASPDTI
ncbi:MAG: PadR family transcriptional regulator [Candidatus Limnocylindrales bacterium]